MEIVTIGSYRITVCSHCGVLIIADKGDYKTLDMAIDSHFEDNDYCKKNEKELPTLNDIKGLLRGEGDE